MTIFTINHKQLSPIYQINPYKLYQPDHYHQVTSQHKQEKLKHNKEKHKKTNFTHELKLETFQTQNPLFLLT